MLRFITEVLQELLGTISLNIKTNLMWNITGNFPWKTLLLSNATFMHFPQLKVSFVLVCFLQTVSRRKLHPPEAFSIISALASKVLTI